MLILIQYAQGIEVRIQNHIGISIGAHETATKRHRRGLSQNHLHLLLGSHRIEVHGHGKPATLSTVANKETATSA